jgi:ACS family sodium-dependent inorganic phosphate cotransporter
VDVKQSAWLSILPWVVMAVTTNAGGWAADYLINRQLLSVTRTRKLLQTLGADPAAAAAGLGGSRPGGPACHALL